MTDDLAGCDGHYATKQLGNACGLIAWSHRRRFRMAIEFAHQFAGRRIVDYGCGDGTFLALLARSDAVPAEAVGLEVHQGLIDDCRRRLGSLPGLSFCMAEEIDRREYAGRYDAVFCMEVLEHVVEVDQTIERFRRLLRPGGRLVVSVPVEIGGSLLVKQVARHAAGRLGVRDYPGMPPYTWRELWAGIWAGHTPHMRRPMYKDADGRHHHDHMGFNWKALRDRLRREFSLRDVKTSPVPGLPAWISSQVWMTFDA